MKITFIQPAVGRKTKSRYSKTWKMEPMTFAMLKALTPDHVETLFFDDRIEKVDLEVDCDLVAISVESYTAKRAYFFADRFRERGVKVILGGWHTTLIPEEALQHADAVLIGDAEHIWSQVIEDLEAGSLEERYSGQPGFAGVMPDRSLYDGKSYLPVKLIETGRGCPHSCEFCAITCFYDAHYYHRPLPEIMAELKATQPKNVFLVDDNLTADRKFALELFKEIAKLNITWSGQTTLSIANDDEMLYWMRKSGCEMILIGFESLNTANLKQMSKEWNAKLGERDELVRKIHRAGINIYGTFMFGMDEDDVSTVKEALAFAKKHALSMCAFNHVLPFPGTPLYAQLLKEKRFIFEKWWLAEDYSFGLIPFQPKKTDAFELSQHCLNARNSFYTITSILSRSWKVLTRTKSLWLGFKFMVINFLLKAEVNQRFGMKLAYGLDKKI
jgi:radical SAM superfamily enzyme YgiQ (UPF0313 family)